MLPLSVSHKQKLKHFFLIFFLFSLGTALIINALKDSINLYLTPSDLKKNPEFIKQHKKILVGGLVQPGSVVRDKNLIHFTITDFDHEIKVSYTGALPGLFKEGTGVITQGEFEEGIFVAKRVLAKHDENYRVPTKGSTYG